MILSCVLATMLLSSPADTKLAKEARFLAALPVNATYADIRKAMPSGTKLVSNGFHVSSDEFGTAIELSGVVEGRALVASKQNAQAFTRWLADKTSRIYPAFPLSSSDQVQWIQIDTGRDFAESDKEIQQTYSILSKEFGKTNVPNWQDWGCVIEWPEKGIEYREEDLADAYVALIKTYKVDFLPSFPKSKTAVATKEDYEAIVLAMAGKKQNRLCITSGLLRQLKGYSLKPRSQRSFMGIPKDPSYIAFAGKPNDMPIAIAVCLVAGRRVVELPALAG